MLYRSNHHRYNVVCDRVGHVHIFDRETIQDIPSDVAEALLTFKNTVCANKWLVPIRTRHGDLEVTDDLTLFVARSARGRVLGTIAFNEIGSDGRLEIEYVCSDAGCGYGRELMNRFSDWLHGRISSLPRPPEWSSITLTSVSEAVGFYLKIGFVYHDDNRELSLVMHRKDAVP